MEVMVRRTVSFTPAQALEEELKTMDERAMKENNARMESLMKLKTLLGDLGLKDEEEESLFDRLEKTAKGARKPL